MRRALALTVALALAGGLAACGGDEGEATTDGTTTTVAGETTTTAEGSPSTTEAATTAPDETTTTTTGSEDPPGEPLDLFPYEGAELAVVGVAAADTLNVRSGPGTDFDVVAEAAPTATGLVATGRNRQLDDGAVWAEVEHEGATGWVNVAYVSEPGATRDVSEDVPGASADTLAELAEIVAASRAPSGEGPQPTVVVVAESESSVTVDVLGLADDAQEGERLHVEAALATQGTGFAVVSVEATALCTRGVTAEGLCT